MNRIFHSSARIELKASIFSLVVVRFVKLNSSKNGVKNYRQGTRFNEDVVALFGRIPLGPFGARG